MRALSTNRGRPSVLGIFWRCALRAPGNSNATAVLADALVLHVAADQCEQRVVAADAHAGARHDLGPALPDDDRACVDKLAAIDLDAEHLRVRVAAVPRRAATFLVRQTTRSPSSTSAVVLSSSWAPLPAPRPQQAPPRPPWPWAPLSSSERPYPAQSFWRAWPPPLASPRSPDRHHRRR